MRNISENTKIIRINWDLQLLNFEDPHGIKIHHTYKSKPNTNKYPILMQVLPSLLSLIDHGPTKIYTVHYL